jgi:hypothetical protein
MTDPSEGTRSKQALHTLRERVGGPRPEVRERNRRHRKLRKAIRDALAGNSLTVPDLAVRVEAAKAETFWMLMAMKKYGEIAEGPERDGYFEYTLLKKEEEQ